MDREDGIEKSTENILHGPVASVSEASETSDGAGSHERASASARRHID